MSASFWCRLVFVVAVTALCGPALAQPLLTAAALQDDLRSLRRAIDTTHPDVHAFADAAALDAAFGWVDAQLRVPMDRDAAWRVFATLNPVFADTHVTVLSPDARGQTLAWLKAGAGLFPFEVQVHAAGDVEVLADLGGAPGRFAGQRILRIDGKPIEAIASTLLARTSGDTAAFARANLSRRWWWFYWKTFGAPQQFEIELQPGGGDKRTVRVAASNSAPAWLLDTDPANFDRAFSLRPLADGVALLTVNTFDWPDKTRFHAFMRGVFTQLRETKTSTLVIDIRNNGGGDDELWKEGLLRYIADKPYRHGSAFLLKVIEGRQRDGQKVGDVVQGQIQGWVQPAAEEPLRFRGKTVVVAGRNTYSSAVLFSNVVQDFGFARLVGVGGHARTRQTGGTQVHTLPNSGLQIVVPRFILDRPSGAREPPLLTPDIELADDPRNPQSLLTALLKTLKLP